MITPETFAKMVFERFDTLDHKIDDKFKTQDGKIDDLCNRTTRIEDSFNSHLEVNKAISNEQTTTKTNNNTKMFLGMGIAGVVFGALDALARFFHI